MGNGVSSATTTTPTLSGSKETTKRFKETLDLIATQYITTNDFKGLKMLVNEKYCDDLTILTKDILATRFTTKEIKTLAKTDTFFYISKNELARLEANTKDKKNRMCKQIARFYVRIAHLFASIITTVYPNWSDSGNGQQGQGQGQGQGIEFCNARINALKNSILEKKGDVDAVNIQPTVCSLYSNSSTLYAAPGFSALEVLYNDEYDETTGTFNRRSGAMQVKYENDLAELYEAFTGKTSKPSEIKSFSDINITALSSRFSECGPKQKPDRSAEILQQEQLQQQQRQQQQQEQDEQRRRQEQQYPYEYRQREQNPMARIMEENNRELERIKLRAEIKEKSIREEGANMSGVMATNTSTNLRVKKTESSFSNYAAHIRTMAANADKFKAKLLEIVDKLFLVVKNDATSNQAKITIHPALSNEMLNQLVNQTRDIIVQLYLGCERDFYTGIKLLRVIVEEKMQETMEAALLNLKTETVKQVKVLSQRNKENESTKRQNDVKALLDNANKDKNDINVASDEREDALKKITKELTDKKYQLDEAKQKSDDFKKELDLINAKIKQYEDELKLVPVPGDAKLTAKITDLNAKKAATEAGKAAVDSEITTLTSVYNDLKTKYSA
jgi:hypothetical protein